MKTSARGFTLIEMIVSLAIFAFVVTAVTAAYLNIINIDRQSRGLNDLVNNLSFALDSMSRDIRTGTNYQCGGYGGTNCALSPSSTFTFVNSAGQQVTYLLSKGEIGECTGVIGSACTAASATYITQAPTDIETLAFYVNGVGKGDGVQPTVTFTIHGTLPTGPTDTVTFTTQTTATERGIDMIKGFTLIETLVAIAILTMSMVAPFYAVEQSITAADVSRDELAGSMLAQEGLEYVREVRDDDYLYNRGNGTTRSWLYGLDGSGGSPNCFSSAGTQCTVDPLAADYGQANVVSYPTSSTLPPLYLSLSSDPLPYVYNQDSIGAPSAFTRTVQLACVSGGTCVPGLAQEVKVTVTVTYTTRNIPYTTSVTEYLDNWL